MGYFLSNIIISKNPEGVMRMSYLCGRCEKKFDTVFTTVFHLGGPPLEMNLCKRCLDDVNSYYDTYNILIRRKVIAKLQDRQKHKPTPLSACPGKVEDSV